MLINPLFISDIMKVFIYLDNPLLLRKEFSFKQRLSDILSFYTDHVLVNCLYWTERVSIKDAEKFCKEMDKICPISTWELYHLSKWQDFQEYIKMH